MLQIEQHKGIHVLRDDLLPGGTKSILLPDMVNDNHDEYVYASPVYGGFQIALSLYCRSVGKQATIFCAKRKEMHENTKACFMAGARIIEVPYGYLSVIEKRARDYCEQTGAKKLTFGAYSLDNITKIALRMRQITKALGKEPKEVWCAVGSGTLMQGILAGTDTAIVNGVQVGATFQIDHPRARIKAYHRPFAEPSRHIPEFKSMKNYDLKAWEYCLKYNQGEDVFFWNVL